MSSRFEKELEFVQLLCNPEYIRWLYNEGYFEKQDFIDFLNYLLYFKDKKYSKFLTYPQCLIILEILIDKNIKEKLGDDNFYKKLGEDQIVLWRNRD